jgi:heptosyltransferase-3
VYADTAPMLAGHPALDQLYVVGRAWRRSAPAPARGVAVVGLRARRYDLIVHFPSRRAGLRPRACSARAYSVAPAMAGAVATEAQLHLIWYRCPPTAAATRWN